MLAITKKVHINKDLSVEMTITPRGFKMEWDPDFPGVLSPEEMRRYREGRDGLAAEVSERLGGRVLMVEL